MIRLVLLLSLAGSAFAQTPALVADLTPGPLSSFIRYATDLDGYLYFQHEGAVPGNYWWRSRGTAGSTVRLQLTRLVGLSNVVEPLVASRLPCNVPNDAFAPPPASVNGVALLWAYTALDGCGLYAVPHNSNTATLIWKSDLIQLGTRLVRVGNFAYFSAVVPNQGLELFRTDGTAAGTHFVKDLVPGLASSSPEVIGSVGEIALIRAQLDGHTTLWRSDGTPAGTFLLYDPGENGAIANGPAVLFQGQAHFAASRFDPSTNASNNTQLLRTDGTLAGTVVVHNFANRISPQDLTVAGNRLIFKAAVSTFGGLPCYAVFTTDGTPASLEQLPVAGTCGDLSVKQVGHFAFLHQGAAFHRTQGTAATTVSIQDSFSAGAHPMLPVPAAATSGYLFGYDQANSATRLWRITGFPNQNAILFEWPLLNGGYVPLDNMVVSGNRLYLTVSTAAHGNELWSAELPPRHPLNTYSLPAGSGTVALTPSTLDGAFDTGTAVQLSALPNAGFAFSGFGGDLVGPAASQSLIVDRPRTVAANFATLQNPAITLTPTGRGDAGGNRFYDFLLRNSGTGAATAITIHSLQVQPLAGSGTISSATVLPLQAGALAANGTANLRLFFSVPATVTRFRLTVNGTVTNAAGVPLSFSLVQALFR